MAGGVAVEVCVTGHVVCTVREQSEMIACQLLSLSHSFQTLSIWEGSGTCRSGGSSLLS